MWDRIKRELDIGRYQESEHHLHLPEERAEEFRCRDGGTTELEYLDVIHALVRASKPMTCLETGAWKGFGTLAIASALAENGGAPRKVVSVDREFPDEMRKNLHRYGLTDIVELVQSDTLAHCSFPGECYDFAFFDSDVHIRWKEHRALVRGDRLHEWAVCVFHDTSIWRLPAVDRSQSYINYVRELPHAIHLPLSRGLTLQGGQR